MQGKLGTPGIICGNRHVKLTKRTLIVVEFGIPTKGRLNTRKLSVKRDAFEIVI